MTARRLATILQGPRTDDDRTHLGSQRARATTITWWPAPRAAKHWPSIRSTGKPACSARGSTVGTITQIFNTHEHADHTAGNAGLATATGATVLAHAAAAARIGGVTRGLPGGDVIRVGHAASNCACLDTPGHTLTHLCLYGERRRHRAGAVLRRYAVQCRRRQLPPWRGSGALFETFARRAGAPAASDAHVSRT